MARILGIDYGEKRIGLAISDPLLIIAHPLTFVEKLEDIKEIINKYPDLEEIVIGLPKSMSGEIKESAQKVLSFVEELKKQITVPIKTWDERLTTVAMQKSLISLGVSRKKRKKKIDQSAAAYMLQGYLDAKK